MKYNLSIFVVVACVFVSHLSIHCHIWDHEDLPPCLLLKVLFVINLCLKFLNLWVFFWSYLCHFSIWDLFAQYRLNNLDSSSNMSLIIYLTVTGEKHWSSTQGLWLFLKKKKQRKFFNNETKPHCGGDFRLTRGQY